MAAKFMVPSQLRFRFTTFKLPHLRDLCFSRIFLIIMKCHCEGKKASGTMGNYNSQMLRVSLNRANLYACYLT